VSWRNSLLLLLLESGARCGYCGGAVSPSLTVDLRCPFTPASDIAGAGCGCRGATRGSSCSSSRLPTCTGRPSATRAPPSSPRSRYPSPPWRQPRGKTMVSLVNSYTDATRIGWHLWEIDLRFAPGLPPGWRCKERERHALHAVSIGWSYAPMTSPTVEPWGGACP